MLDATGVQVGAGVGPGLQGPVLVVLVMEELLLLTLSTMVRVVDRSTISYDI